METLLSASSANQEQLSRLKSNVVGSVVLRGEEGYDAARASWNLAIDQQPEVIVVAQSETDVVAAVRFAAESELPITVQATGHGQPRTVANGLLINLARLTNVEIDADARLARVGGGVQWGEVIQAAHAHGLAPVSGSAPHVGVVGYTIGGGYGIVSRAYGLAIDQVTAFRIVTPDGEVRHATANTNSDLFFAVLGGGGAYGVITEIEFKLHGHAEIFGGSVMFDASRAPEVYEAFAAWCESVPNEVSGALHLMTFPPVPFIPEFLHGRSMAIFIGSVVGSQEEAEKWLAPMRNLEGAEFDSFRMMPYTESGSIFQDPVDPLPANGRGVLLKEFTTETARAFLEAIGPIPQSPNLMIQLRQIGGAITTASDERSSIRRNREAKFLTYFLGVPMPHNPPEAMAEHAESVFTAIAPWTLARGPLNFLGEANVSSQHIAENFSPDELEQVTSVKRAFDPENRFANAGVGIR